MLCPYCQHEIAEMWQPFYVVTDGKGGRLAEPSAGTSVILGEEGISVSARWMQCPNGACQQLLVHVRRAIYDPHARTAKHLFSGPDEIEVEEVIAFPKHQMSRNLNPLVPEPYARDFREACLILEYSPRMSAVLSRRILSDLLKNYAGCEGQLSKQINDFVANPKYPSNVKENLHYLREIGNFSAHTQSDVGTGEIIDVGPDEADWTLTVLESLFDYFIIEPEKDAQRRAEIDAKLKRAGRKPIGKLPPPGSP